MITSLLQLIDQAVKLHSGQPAMVYRDTILTYKQLDTISNQLAAFFIKSGIKKGDIVGILIDRSAEMLITMLAILKSGAAYIPMDPDYPRKRIAYILGDCNAQLLITNAKYKTEVESPVPKLIIEEIWPEIDSFPETGSFAAPGQADLAYLIYTSGSTGMPKGVMIEHGNLLNLLQSMQKFPGITADDRLLSVTTVSFDISVLELYLPLTLGATLYLADTETAKNGEALIDFIQKKEITFFQATPSTYKMMLAAEWQEKLDIKALCCGEQLPKDLAEKILPRVTALYNMYGPTETTIYSTGKQILPSDELITIGKPIDNTSIYILNEDQKEVKTGDIGEIYIGGLGLARAYYGKPELTRQKFIQFELPGQLSQRLYKTGDLGKLLPNGEILCLGRIDHQVKIRGYRIETAEIDYTLLQQPQLREVVVKPWTDRKGYEVLVAYIVTADHSTPGHKTINQWKAQLRSALPAYMIPTYFVSLERIPLTDNGKVDRNALPEPEFGSQTSADTLAESENERMLSDIWVKELGLSKVGIHDNFFDLGGHSLTAVMIVSQIKKKTGKNIPLGSLFKNPTITELAKLLEKTELDQYESLIPIKPEGSKPPLYIVHGMGSTVFKFRELAEKLDPEQPVYGLQARGLDGRKPPATSMEEMAGYYLDEILKHNPAGPYAIAGYSLGGFVAMEIVRRLEQMNKKVCLFACFDTIVLKNNQLDEGWQKKFRKVSFRIAKFFYTFSLLVREPRRTVLHKIASLTKGYKKMMGQEIGLENNLPENFEQMSDVIVSNQTALSNYKVKPYHGTMHLFKARKAQTYISDFKYLGWKPYVKDLQVHMIDADHIFIFDKEYNARFAHALQKILDEAVC
ncbi:non-ribosomal peptide synthetase [Pedobacter sp. GR22-6]|uniref:non-ribosomal peptide synthetase n=1 Tax=Pedobacter sp. GR22-6 TaxID=3127957 RepID=UPI00307E6F33